jgi:hypothetical protein
MDVNNKSIFVLISKRRGIYYKLNIMRDILKSLMLILMTLVINVDIFACTTVVVSGKYTEDGRPILYKLRDTETFENKVKYYEGEKYSFIGLINSKDIEGENVWGGHNDAGFGIMNSASFNLRNDDTASFKDQEGIFMRKALGYCKTLEDFENLLLSMNKPWGLEAHFGVVDANGGAAFYETCDTGYIKFDANDASVAPAGYVIRTNYSFTGKRNVGYGFIRFQSAQEMMADWEAVDDINFERFIVDAPRMLTHSLMNTDYSKVELPNNSDSYFVNSGDLMTRHGTASSIVIHGVKKGQQTSEMVSYINVSFPLTCFSVPVWVRGEKFLPHFLVADDDQNCELNTLALELKKECYPVTRSAGYKYLNLVPLLGDQGYLSTFKNVDRNIIKMVHEMNGDYSTDSISNLYERINILLNECYYSK